MTGEDPFPAWRRTEPLCVERPRELQRRHPVQAILAAARREHLQLIVRLGKRPTLERHTNSVRPGCRRETDLLQTRIDAIQRTVLDLVVLLHVLFAADDR